MGKLNTHSPIYCMKDNWENWLNLRHTLDRMYLTSIFRRIPSDHVECDTLSETMLTRFTDAYICGTRWSWFRVCLSSTQKQDSLDQIVCATGYQGICTLCPELVSDHRDCPSNEIPVLSVASVHGCLRRLAHYTRYTRSIRCGASISDRRSNSPSKRLPSNIPLNRIWPCVVSGVSRWPSPRKVVVIRSGQPAREGQDIAPGTKKGLSRPSLEHCRHAMDGPKNPMSTWRGRNLTILVCWWLTTYWDIGGTTSEGRISCPGVG